MNTFQNTQLIYYKASGHWPPFGLLALYGAVAFGALGLCLVSHLFWAYFPDARLSSVLMLVAWFWLTCIVAKFAVKVFKVRNPGMAFSVTMFGVLSGYLVCWALFWLQTTEDVHLIDFIKINISKPFLAKHFLTFKEARAGLTGGPLILGLMLGLYFLFPSAMAKIQAGYPFNEKDNRWFQKKTLPPIAFYGPNAVDAEKYLDLGEIDKFILCNNYRITSEFAIGLSLFYKNGVIRLWFYYDRNRPEVYLSVLHRSLGNIFNSLQTDLRISRRQANKLVSNFSS